ncbi:MAG: site-specific DNA-methyltransferase [Patescibacteria group bacterium]|nr:site-specific DNA-methyltransferase [Patescibacteria group bacterium]
MTVTDVLTGKQQWGIFQGDRLESVRQLPDDSIDLIVTSPPYEKARTYGIDFSLRGQAWVDWMIEPWAEWQRVCKGLIVCVCEGQTRGRRWSAVPALLMADLHRAGFNLRKPPIFQRVGIPGSGGKRADHAHHGGSADWLRNDYEFIICTSRPGLLPWADTLANGHKPKWAPGGEMSNRNTNGTRRNQWAGGELSSGGERQTHGERRPAGRPSHALATRRRLGRGNEKGTCGRRISRGHANGDATTSDSYDPPAIANPGNVIKAIVGGGVMGDKECHENEAPFPEKLAEFFVRAFCPAGGLVLDPFSGSGTTVAVAVKMLRRGLGFDIRQSQVALGRRRLSGITPAALVE